MLYWTYLFVQVLAWPVAFVLSTVVAAKAYKKKNAR